MHNHRSYFLSHPVDVFMTLAVCLFVVIFYFVAVTVYPLNMLIIHSCFQMSTEYYELQISGHCCSGHYFIERSCRKYSPVATLLRIVTMEFNLVCEIVVSIICCLCFFCVARPCSCYV